MKIRDLRTWPPSCWSCHEPVDSWPDAGINQDDRWYHKRCWANWGHSASDSLRSPAEAKLRGLPTLLLLLLVHVGGGAAVLGWFVTTNFETLTWAIIVLVIGTIGFLLGVAGFAIDVAGLYRQQLIKQGLDAGGGWEGPGDPP